MKVLLSWVREFVDIDEPAEAIGRKLSLRGLPLEGIEPMGDDALMDFEVTANRPDCMSMAGIAREIAVVYGLPFRSPHAAWPDAGAGGGSAASSLPALPITIETPDLCARYVGAVADVTIAPSPAWMADRLTACGVRPISNVVDITNYVLLELGQPMHAFDHARLAGPAIVVRRARSGETLATLDGKARTLTTDMLVIADAERASAIGGVMGGAESEVSSSTRRIVFESAWFKPQSVRATSRALGLRTEASTRFERGADLTASAVAMVRACELLARLGAGTAGALVDVYPARHRPPTLFLAQPRVEGLLGMHVPDGEIVRILEALGFGVERAPGGWSVVAPGWRVDMHRDVDLIEEIGRHHGFEHLPATFPGVQQAPAPSDPRIARDARARRAALAAGFSEAISFAFIEARHAEPFQGGEPPVALANPLSEKFAVMRPSLVPGLVEAVSHNRRHGRRDVQLFEIGTRFSPRGETRAMGLAWTGLATPDHWSGGRRDVDFFDMKGVVEQLASLFDVELSALAPAEGSVADTVLVPGRAAALASGDHIVGWVGQLQAAIGDAHDLPANDVVYVAECDLDALSPAAIAPARMTTPLPRFPAAVRDIAMLVDESLSAATVRGTIRSKAPSTLVGVTEFDRYQGKGIPDGKVSLALRLTFQSLDRTLTDAEVEAATTAVVDLLASEFGAVRR
ncbi:MAG: phenylalanine--tRNA ligase subunit beta [Vicinamibacterales bacterium]